MGVDGLDVQVEDLFRLALAGLHAVDRIHVRLRIVEHKRPTALLADDTQVGVCGRRRLSDHFCVKDFVCHFLVLPPVVCHGIDFDHET